MRVKTTVLGLLALFAIATPAHASHAGDITAGANAGGGSSIASAPELPLGQQVTGASTSQSCGGHGCWPTDFWRVALKRGDKLKVDFGTLNGTRLTACLATPETTDYTYRQVNCGVVYQDAGQKGELTYTAPSAGEWVLSVFGNADLGYPDIAYELTGTIQRPTGAIVALVNPVVPKLNQAAVITVSGSSEVSKAIYATVRPASAGASCAPTFDAELGINDALKLVSGDAAIGTFSVDVSYTWTTPGSYLICLWLADSSSDPAPIAGPQPQSMIVTAPAIKVARVVTLGCAHLKPIANFFASNISGVCIQYAFAVAPQAGQHATIAFVSPAHKTVRKVGFNWTLGHKLSFVAARLQRSAYLHHHGRWQVILLIDGKFIKSSIFRVH